jgi:DNA-directed RNA polymerase specialized sigma24 family protein
MSRRPGRMSSSVPLTAAQRRLAEESLPIYAGAVARQRHQWPRVADDAESNAGLTLVACARDYVPGGLVPFAAYYRFRARMGLKDLLRRALAHGWAEVKPGQYDRLAVIDEAESPPEPPSADELFADLTRRLSPRSRAMAYQVWVLGRTLEEVSWDYTISATRVSTILIEAKAKIRATTDRDDY